MFTLTFHVPVIKGEYVGINHATEVFNSLFDAELTKPVNTKINYISRESVRSFVPYEEPIYSNKPYDLVLFDEPVRAERILPVYSGYDYSQAPGCDYCRNKSYKACWYVEYEDPARRPVNLCEIHYGWLK